MESAFDIEETLKNFPDDAFSIMLRHLEKTGYFFDEHDGICLGSVLMERHKKEIERFLRLKGYSGGALTDAAKYYPSHGAVYALFDTAKTDSETVINSMDKFIDIKSKDN
jgi:hypothetical protein